MATALPGAAAEVLPTTATQGNGFYVGGIIGLIGASQTVTAKNCRKGWCAVAGGYVQSAYLRFSRAAADEAYDYNVPLALPPYGYSPGFWGYGGRRYYDKYGNYSKFGQRGYLAPTAV
jgi:hypothetical protein